MIDIKIGGEPPTNMNNKISRYSPIINAMKSGQWVHFSVDNDDLSKVLYSIKTHLKRKNIRATVLVDKYSGNTPEIWCKVIPDDSVGQAVEQ